MKITCDQHGGNLRAISNATGLSAAKILDFSANINPLGPVPALSGALRKAVAEIVRYPDPDNVELVETISRRFGWRADRIVVGNGATELLHALCRSMGCRRAVIPVPSYSDYAAAAQCAGMKVVQLEMDPANGFEVPWQQLGKMLRDNDLVILGNPNNPTGRLIDGAALRGFVKRHPAVSFIVDESFIEFTDAESLAGHLPANAVVLRSMTKFYAIPGLRLGFVVARPQIVSRLRGQLPSWSVNCMAQRAGIVSLKDRAYADRSRAFVAGSRLELSAGLKKVRSLEMYESDSNFIMLRIVRPDLDAIYVRGKLLEKGIAIRVCANFAGLDAKYFRVAVRTPAENSRLLKVLRTVLEE